MASCQRLQLTLLFAVITGSLPFCFKRTERRGAYRREGARPLSQNDEYCAGMQRYIKMDDVAHNPFISK